MWRWLYSLTLKMLSPFKYMWKGALAFYNYFRHGMFMRPVFKCMGFTGKEYAAFELLSYAKRRSGPTWFGNNLIYPVMVVFSPFVATLIHFSFGTINYQKSILEIAIGGSITLIGINVLRSASTYISEKLDESKIPESLKSQWPEFSKEIEGIKNKLKMRVQIFFFLGVLAYFIQAAQLINAGSNDVYYYLLVIVLIALASVIVGRFIHLLESNFLDGDPKVIEGFVKTVTTQGPDYERMMARLTNEGGL